MIEYLGLISSELNPPNYDRAYIVKRLEYYMLLTLGVMIGNCN